jgi:hypothetical protein
MAARLAEFPSGSHLRLRPSMGKTRGQMIVMGIPFSVQAISFPSCSPES